MKLRPNRIRERKAMNAARAFFEAQGSVFQEVDAANDYGKDAYLDIVEELRVTGLCVALQVKGGASYRTRDGNYRIPVDAGHAQIWAHSTIPVFGIVHDERDDSLHWVNLTDHLRGMHNGYPASIQVPKENVLTPVSLLGSFRSSAEATRAYPNQHPLLQVQSAEPAIRDAAVIDCFALGRSDPRVLIGLRYLLRALPPTTRRLAVRVLSHVTPHPDILWHAGNWIPEDVKRQVRPHLDWSGDEVVSILEAIQFEEFERGRPGEDVVMLLAEDPHVDESLRYAAVRALRERSDDVATAALYLLLYWLGEKAPEVFEEFVKDFPEVRRLGLFPEIAAALSEHGYLTLF